MKVFGNLISIQRGEEFTIDFTLVNKDDTPYIIPIELPIPYILITVGSNSFNTENAYVLNQWCDLTHSPRFQSTEIEAYTGTTPSDYYEEGNTSILGEGSGAVIYYNKCVFYNSTDGKYYYYTENGYVEYSFSVRVAFSTDITSEWWAQQYTYDITLVSGAELNPSAASESDYSDKITTRIPILVGGTITVSNQIGG